MGRLLGALPVLVAGLLAGSVYRFRITRHRQALARLRAPLRVAHLSDLHFGRFIGGRSVRAWVDATLREKPDLIVITGDFLDSQAGAARRGVLLRELSRLRAPLGVYAVWGNHDWTSTHDAPPARTSNLAEPEPCRSPGMEAFARELAAAGVRVLVNEGVALREDLYLAGVDDLWYGVPRVDEALAAQRGEAVILLSHNPDLLPRVPAAVSLTLCGHTHGGQIVVPFYGALHTGSAYGQQFLAGWVRRPALAFVSRGLGVTFLPVRLRCPAELVLLDLIPN